MHHLFLILAVLALILIFVFLPFPQALPWSAGVLGLLLAFLIIVSWRQPARPAGAPARPMIGSRAEVITVRGNGAEVRWQGEIWYAVSAQPLIPGEDVIIEKVEGLTLRVRPLTPQEKQRRING